MMRMNASTSEEHSYSGAITAIPYAFRTSDSSAFKLYTVVGGLITLGGSLLFVLGIVALLGRISGTPAGVLTFLPALYILVWLFTVAPIAAPVLLVARQHRLERGDSSYDRSIALTGFVFIVALYLAAIISTPQGQQETVQSGLVAPLVQFLYGLPRSVGVVPPLLAAAVMVIVHRSRSEG